MKVTIEMDVTPQEMRVLLGLPEVESLQQEIMQKMRERLLADIESGNAADFMRLMMPTPEQFKSLESLQQAFWNAFSGGMKPSGGGKD